MRDLSTMSSMIIDQWVGIPLFLNPNLLYANIFNSYLSVISLALCFVLAGRSE